MSEAATVISFEGILGFFPGEAVKDWKKSQESQFH
jgi:hypothetical protein